MAVLIMLGNTLSIVSISLDTLFKIRPVGVVLNMLNGFLKICVLIKIYIFSAALTVPNIKITATIANDITTQNQTHFKRQKLFKLTALYFL